MMQLLLVLPVTESSFWTLTAQIDRYDEMDLFCGLCNCVMHFCQLIPVGPTEGHSLHEKIHHRELTQAMGEVAVTTVQLMCLDIFGTDWLWDLPSLLFTGFQNSFSGVK